MKQYKKWTPQERWRNLQMLKDAQRAGLWEHSEKCDYCGQEKGIIQTHCIDYDTSLRLLPKLLQGTINHDERKELRSVLKPVCWRCHMMIHRGERHPKSRDEYFAKVANGEQYAPVYKPDDWAQLDKHMID